MKNSIIQQFALLPVMLLFIHLEMMNAQSPGRMVIASCGQNLTSSAATLSFTLGETVVATLNSGIELSQGFHQEWAVVTAVDNVLAAPFQVNIYPNPTSGWLNITSDVAARLSLFDLSGKMVFLSKMQAGTDNINIGDLAPGMFVLVMVDDDGNRATFKVQVTE